MNNSNVTATKSDIPHGDKRPFFYGWVIVFAAGLAGFLTTGLGGFAHGILLPHLADDFAGGSRGQISLAISLAAVCVAIAGPFVGRHADRNSPRRVMLAGACLLALSYILLASSTALWHVFVALSLIYALAVTMAGPLVRSIFVTRWFTRLRGRALGLSAMGTSIAGISLPVLVSGMVSEYGWRITVCGFAVAVALILVPAVALLLRDKPEDMGLLPDGNRPAASDATARDQERTIGSDPAWTWSAMLRSKALWAIGLTFGPMVCVYIIVMVHLFGHTVESGLNNTQAAMILSAFAFATAISKPVIGLMADVMGARITLWSTLIAQAFALAAFTFADSVSTFMLAAMIHGFGFAALASMRPFALAKAFGVRSLGSALGLLSWIELPFTAIASPLAGFVFDVTGSYDSAFLVFAGFLLVGCIGPFLLRSELRNDPVPATARQRGGF